jgi:hypothetical protein
MLWGSKSGIHTIICRLCCWAICLVLVGCSSLNPQTSATQATLPTPTIAAFFRDPQVLPSTTSSVTTNPVRPTRTTRPPATPAPTARPVPGEQIAEIAIYDEKLDQNWSLQNSQGMTFDLSNTNYVHSGKVAALFTPSKGFGTAFFSLREDATDVYTREDVLGVSFWLNSGEGSIKTSDLAVAVVGSNSYTYWLANDTSVPTDTTITVEAPLFSETRLYDLHVNRTIPPETWVQVVVWLDDLIYDPEYMYVTGMYIKNNKGFLNTFYIDQVHLLMTQQP